MPVHVEIAEGTSVDNRVNYFTMRVQSGGQEWNVRKRYTDFANLDQQLRTQGQVTLLGLPPKGKFDWKKVARRAAFLEDRRNGLHMYMNHIADQFQTLSDNPVLQNFFLNEAAPGSPLGAAQVGIREGSAPSDGGRSDASRSPRRNWFRRKDSGRVPGPEEFQLTEVSWRPRSGASGEEDADSEST